MVYVYFFISLYLQFHQPQILSDLFWCKICNVSEDNFYSSCNTHANLFVSIPSCLSAYGRRVYPLPIQNFHLGLIILFSPTPHKPIQFSKCHFWTCLPSSSCWLLLISIYISSILPPTQNKVYPPHLSPPFMIKAFQGFFFTCSDCNSSLLMIPPFCLSFQVSQGYKETSRHPFKRANYVHLSPASQGCNTGSSKVIAGMPTPYKLANATTPWISLCESACFFICQHTAACLLCLLLLSCFSPVWLPTTLRTIARQAPRSMGFCRQEY